MEIKEALVGLQVAIDPLTGVISLQARWVNFVSNIVSSPRELVNLTYPSIEIANQKALDFQAFSAIAAQFSSQPFTAIADLLEALREVQAQEEAERQAQLALDRLQEAPFEGAP